MECERGICTAEITHCHLPRTQTGRKYRSTFLDHGHAVQVHASDPNTRALQPLGGQVETPIPRNTLPGDLG